MATRFTPTRAAAQSALAAFLGNSGEAYRERRSFDFGAAERNTVSRLSPWIRHRLLLEDEVLASVLQHHGPAASEAFLQEVFWRGYFRGYLEHRPTIWSRYLSERDAEFARITADLDGRARLREATSGATGITCFDAWVRELIANGYLHNHARMWFASIWIFTLKLPWQLGADFFLTHLIDGDPASNTCSWRWVAGLHTLGKTYLARPDNIGKYTGGRFVSTRGLATEAPALLEREAHTLSAPNLEPEAACPAGGRIGLLIVESDCQPESLALSSKPCCLLTLTEPCARALEPLAPTAADFTRAALTHAGDEASRAFELPNHRDAAGDWTTSVSNWALANQLDCVTVARPPIGWVHDRLQPALSRLAELGVRVERVTRPHDRAVWPHASKGYFKLKKRIPDLLAALDLA